MGRGHEPVEEVRVRRGHDVEIAQPPRAEGAGVAAGVELRVAVLLEAGRPERGRGVVVPARADQQQPVLVGAGGCRVAGDAAADRLQALDADAGLDEQSHHVGDVAVSGGTCLIGHGAGVSVWAAAAAWSIVGSVDAQAATAQRAFSRAARSAQIA